MASNPDQNERDIAAIIKILPCLQPDTSTRLKAFAQETAGPGSTPHQIQWHMMNVIWNDTQQGRGSFGDRLPYRPNCSLPQIYNVPARITYGDAEIFEYSPAKQPQLDHSTPAAAAGSSSVANDTLTGNRRRISGTGTKRNANTNKKLQWNPASSTKDTKLKEIEERISRMIKDVEEDLGGDISKAELQKMLGIQLIKRGTQLIEEQ